VKLKAVRSYVHSQFFIPRAFLILGEFRYLVEPEFAKRKQYWRTGKQLWWKSSWESKI